VLTFCFYLTLNWKDVDYLKRMNLKEIYVGLMGLFQKRKL